MLVVGGGEVAEPLSPWRRLVVGIDVMSKAELMHVCSEDVGTPELILKDAQKEGNQMC